MEQVYGQIQKFVFPYIESNMYILLEGENALVIDPHVSKQAEEFLQKVHITNVTMILTHEHFDHTNGIPWFRERYSCKLICHEEAMNKKRQKILNRPMVEVIKLQGEGKFNEAEEIEKAFPGYMFEAEITFDEVYEIEWNSHRIKMEHAPGHSPASCIISLDDKFFFTGDSLIPDIAPTLKWPWSSADVFREETVPKLRQIPANGVIMPGHYECVEKSKLVYKNDIFMIKRV